MKKRIGHSGHLMTNDMSWLSYDKEKIIAHCKPFSYKYLQLEHICYNLYIEK